ncbi:hypothetical protein B0O99DRAFT_511844 [Bisporella sp. PMI_857]|nr:hypothetical protein B0O99DRAFT_511844 [Bisporella sp. PMI_857]
MQFSVVTVALFAGAAMAVKQSTIYQTEEITITSCAPTVTNCPAASTVVSLTSYPVVSPTETPAGPSYPVYTPSPSSHANVSVPVYVPSSTAEGVKTTPVPVYPTGTPAAPSSYSLSTIEISTCVPTVIYSTVTLYPTTSPVPTYAPAPSSTGTIVVPGNVTYPTVPATPSTSEFAGAASSIKGSFAVAAVAGFAAFFL